MHSRFGLSDQDRIERIETMNDKQTLSVAKCMLEQASHQLQLSSQFAAAGKSEQARLHRNVAQNLVRQIVQADRRTNKAR
jgi:hypothetical protein